MKFEEIQLTKDASGHFLNSTQCFSADDQWIVYDGRNDDAQIASTGTIAMVNTVSGEIRNLYQTPDQSRFGPGVGAATFSPVADRVLFIHGIRNASADSPYSITRRTGVAVDLNNAGVPVFMDARNILSPYTTGALRGGTHAHTWSGDGQWISFTYNDHILEQAGKSDDRIKDLRTVGVMIPGKRVVVPTYGMENNNGELFSMLVTDVTPDPKPGSDEIEKAFDETWIGRNGYQKSDGSRQCRAIAYQGNVRDRQGVVKTEIFVVDIPDDILILSERHTLTGSLKTAIPPPPELRRRRISFTDKGVTSKPRHWLRSNADGTRIAYLAEDENGIVQLFCISPDGRLTEQLTFLDFPIDGPVNFSADGNYIAFIADNSVFITRISSLVATRVTERSDDASRPVGAVNWSNDGKMLCFNRYTEVNGEKFLQIFVLKKMP